MHIPPFDNQNKPIIDVNDEHVPLTYFNIVKLKKGERLLIRYRGMKLVLCLQRAVWILTWIPLALGRLGAEAVMSGMVSRKGFMCQQICLHKWCAAVMRQRFLLRGRDLMTGCPFVVHVDEIDLGSIWV